jgi:phosphopantetheinyl transferase (holo-ACP synthase)
MLSLHDNAKKIAREMKLIEWSVSISHSQHYAVATVTFLGE